MGTPLNIDGILPTVLLPNPDQSHVLPPTGTMASEWSELLRSKPLMSLGVDTMAKDSYCRQRRPSVERTKPVEQAQVFWASGRGRQS